MGGPLRRASLRSRLSQHGVRHGHRLPLLTNPNAPPAFHLLALLAKPTGAICNLDCEYWASVDPPSAGMKRFDDLAAPSG